MLHRSICFCRRKWHTSARSSATHLVPCSESMGQGGTGGRRNSATVWKLAPTSVVLLRYLMEHVPHSVLTCAAVGQGGPREGQCCNA